MSTEEGIARSLADSIPALVALMTPAGKLESVNRQVLDYFGTTMDVLKSWPMGDKVHPDDLPAVIAAWTQAVESGQRYDVEHRMLRSDGVYQWFHVKGFPERDADGRVARWWVLQVDIDDRRRTEALLEGEKQLLEMVAGGRPMVETLDALCRMVERTAQGCFCSIVVVDPSGRHPESGVAPSFPSAFLDSIIERPVSEHWGPCAMAVHLNQQVVAADLRLEARWAGYEWYAIALERGIRACWSTPIVSGSSNVLGAFAIYFEQPGTPSPDQQSLIAQFTHIASIVVERARNDAALKRSEARKTAILSSAIDCIMTINHEGRITEFNPAAERTFGYSRDQVLGRELAEVIIPPSLRERHRQGLARYLATGEARVLGKRVEMTAIRADGTEFPVELAITRIPSEGPPSFTGYLRDITERKRSEEELRRSEALLAEAQRLSSTGSFAWRVDSEFVTYSEQTYRAYAFDPGGPVTLEMIAARIHPEDLHLMSEMIEQARAGSDLDHEYRLQMPDRSVKHMHLVAHATRDQEGRLEYIGAIQDVTQRRLAEAALGKARSELAHVSRVTSLGALTASIAHEVNQPLSGIITNASTCLRMLAADPPNVEGARETARRTLRDGNRASEVIARLRALFSRREGATESLDLNEATREVVALTLSELQRGRVVVHSELADDLPLVTGDRVQLQQVILNLIRNASDAMSGIEDRPRRLVIRTAREPGERVCLSVEDAGVGFDPQSGERLFDAFYTTKSDGMGIGLSVSRSIIELHQGRLWARPNEGPGSTFFFSIPTRPGVGTDAPVTGAPAVPNVMGHP